MANERPTPYVPQKAAAEYINGSERTLEAWRHKGGGPPYFKCGRRVLYLLDDLDAFIRAGRRASTSDSGAR